MLIYIFFKVHVWSFWLIDKMLLINKIKRQHDIKLSYLFYNRKVHVDKDRQYCRKWIFTDLKMHCLVIDIDNHNVLEIVNFLYVKTLKKPVSLTMSSQLTSKLGTRWFYFFFRSGVGGQSSSCKWIACGWILSNSLILICNN